MNNTLDLVIFDCDGVLVDSDMAAQRLQSAPERTVVIEDSIHGAIAAKKAGMYVIGFTGGAHTYPTHNINLETAGAHVVISSMSLLTNEIDHFRHRRSG